MDIIYLISLFHFLRIDNSELKNMITFAKTFLRRSLKCDSIS